MLLQDAEYGSLQGFPVELLTRITHFLRPSSALAFTYTCKRFYTECGISSEDLLGAKALAKDAIFVRKERLRLLCMLFRDRPISGMAVCSGCVKTHHVNAFTIGELVQGPTKRQCFGRVGRLWICPHKTLTFDDLKACQNRIPNKGVDGFNENRFCWYCRRAGGSSCCYERDRSVTIETQCHIMTGRPNVDKTDVAAALKQLDIPICPHLRLCNPFVSSLYDPACGQILGTACSKADQCYNCFKRKCPSCDTQFFFFLFQGTCASLPRLILATKRFFGDFDDITDSQWTSQLVPPGEVRSLEMDWEMCDARLMNEENKHKPQPCPRAVGRLDNIKIPDFSRTMSVPARISIRE